MLRKKILFCCISRLIIRKLKRNGRRWLEHIRIQEAFKQEIYDTFGSNGALYIPHCVIIGKDGKIRQKVAASSEKMEELKKQLEEAIK